MPNVASGAPILEHQRGRWVLHRGDRALFMEPPATGPEMHVLSPTLTPAIPRRKIHSTNMSFYMRNYPTGTYDKRRSIVRMKHGPASIDK